MTTNNFPGIGYITHGHDFNYFKKFSVSAVSFGGGSVDGYQPDDIIRFSTQSIILINETASTVVEYSFNGKTVHGELNGSGTVTNAFKFDNRVVSMMWFRLKSGSGPATITVHAWGTR